MTEHGAGPGIGAGAGARAGAADRGKERHAGEVTKGRAPKKLGTVRALLVVAMVTVREAYRHSLPHPSPTSNSGRWVAARSSSPAFDATPLEHEPSSSSSSNNNSGGGCSCYQHQSNYAPNAATACCQRAVLTNHKFGTILARSLVGRVPDVRQRSIHPDAIPTHGTGNAPRQDYRHVVIVRNYPEAFVSGYLYHKSGRECWRTYNGAPVKQLVSFEWDRNVRKSPHDIGPHPPRNKRTICQYLADESDEDGMKVYMAVALNKWYQGINEYYRVVHDTDRANRTLFLCLGDYPDHDSQVQMSDVVMGWLYPGGHNYTLPPGMIPTRSNKRGHASPGNSTQRLQLLELVQQYDREIFNGTVAATNAMIGCRGTIHHTSR